MYVNIILVLNKENMRLPKEFLFRRAPSVSATSILVDMFFFVCLWGFEFSPALPVRVPAVKLNLTPF